MDNLIKKSIKNHFELEEFAKNKLPQKIREASSLLLNALGEEKKIMWCGNGGSASQAEHLSAEMLGGLNKKKIDPFFSMCLNSDSSFITAWSNDSSFDEIFSRQIKAFGKKNDILILLTTSGNSPNQINAAKMAQNLGVKVLSFTGNDGGELSGLSDCNINIESDSTQRIQEMHIMIGHILCDVIESSVS